MIRKALGYLFVCIIGLFIQATFIHDSFPSAVAPDIILVLTVIVGLRNRNLFGLFGAFFLGLLADFASGQFVGPNAAGCVVAFGVVSIVATRVYADKVFAVMTITLITSVFKSGTFIIMLMSFFGAHVLPNHFVSTIIYEALFSALIAPVVIWLVALVSLRPVSSKPAKQKSVSQWRSLPR